VAGRHLCPASGRLAGLGARQEEVGVRLAALLLACAVAAAEEPPPLGPYAQPGVPVLVAGQETVILDGWTFEVGGLTMIHPPRIPFQACGHAFKAVPDGMLLVGVMGATLKSASLTGS
jgi:hypothetical protein